MPLLKKKINNRQTTVYTHRTLLTEQREPNQNILVISGVSEGYVDPALYVELVVLLIKAHPQ